MKQLLRSVGLGERGERRVEYCDERVCLSICLSVHTLKLSQEPGVQLVEINFLCMLAVF